MISLIAYIPVDPSKRDQAIEAAKEMVNNVKKEKDTLFYSLNISDSDPDTLVFMERYKDKDALNFHSSTSYFKEFMEKTKGFASGDPEVKILNEIESI